MKVKVINGPNINKVGERDSGLYGIQLWKEIESRLFELAESLSVELEVYQSNHEGELIDYIQELECDAAIINLGGYTHTSVALRDTLIDLAKPFIEVHISNLFRREDFRQQSMTADVAIGVITGLGGEGYLLALVALARLLGDKED